ncbi:M3 family metallopeptidase [soil metagenome]
MTTTPRLRFIGLGLALAAVIPLPAPAAELRTIDDLAAEAEKFGVALTIPTFPTTAEAIASEIDALIAHFTETGDAIAQQEVADASYGSTIAPLDALSARGRDVLSPISVAENTSTDPDLRAAATEHLQRFREFEVGFGYREDIYQAVASYAATQPAGLEGERQRFFERVLRDYRRQGFDLPAEKRDRVEALQKEVSQKESTFQTHVREINQPITFTRAELEGVPDSLLDSEGIKTGDDEFTLQANTTFHYLRVLDFAKSEDTRRRMLEARALHAMDENLPVLTQVVKLRTRIAQLLGYATWADYRTETRMSGSQQAVRDFLYELSDGLQPKFDAEIAELQKLKAAGTGEPDATIHGWDVRFYQNILMKEQFNIDTEELRVYFPYENTLQGMFEVYSRIFGITIEKIENPAPWVEGVTLHAITDTESGKPLGLFYLDMFPRDGKYNHFAQFGIIIGREEADGTYQRPTVALICNFPPPSEDTPSLLSLDEVETLFHEFGHVLHSILTEAKTSAFAGTSVPRDFVEAPSQVLEYWVKRKEVLDLFAADYRDPTKKIPEEVLQKLEESEMATIGAHYRRQLSYGLTDLNLHSYLAPEQVTDVAKVGNAVVAETYFPQPEGTAFVASFGHLMGYDSGYYGYAWADVISADMASVFEEADAFLDPEFGMRLRREIFERGDSREVDESIEAFLGRQRSMESFLKMLGISESE